MNFLGIQNETNSLQFIRAGDAKNGAIVKILFWKKNYVEKKHVKPFLAFKDSGGLVS